MPSFSRMWSDPVPKLSSPQIDNTPASIKFPKNFQPVGTWQKRESKQKKIQANFRHRLETTINHLDNISEH